MSTLNGYSPLVNFYIGLSREAFKDCYHGWQRERDEIKKRTINSFRNVPRIKDVATVCDEETDVLLKKYADERLYCFPEEHLAELLEEIAQRLSTLPQSS